MSGSSDTSTLPPDDGISCSRLRFSTQIATPQPAMIPTIQQGDVLDVQIVRIGAAQAVAVLKNGQVVGGLAGGLVNKLRECLLGGKPFKATVTSINGGQVNVDIEPI